MTQIKCHKCDLPATHKVYRTANRKPLKKCQIWRCDDHKIYKLATSTNLDWHESPQCYYIDFNQITQERPHLHLVPSAWKLDIFDVN